MSKSTLKSQQRLAKYYIPIFLVFSISVFTFQYNREKKYKSDMLEIRLEDSNQLVYKVFELTGMNSDSLDAQIKRYKVDDVRITIVDLSGVVVYDNVIGDVTQLENHIHRKEIQEAKVDGQGSDIRTSASNNHPYYYHATRFGNCYVRSSYPYDLNLSSLLSPNNLFLYFLLILSFVVIATLLYFTGQITLKMHREQLEHDSAIRRRLTQHIAHELKTPLSSIIGYMETINNTPDLTPERQQFFIERSYAQAIRLNSLLQDVLTINQMNDAPKTIEMEPVSVTKVVQTVTEDVELQLKEKNMVLELSLGDEIWVKGNSILLYSVFRNLLDNSLAYAGENVTIEIKRTNEDSKFYYFSYSDNGTGVEEQHLSHLFDRFYRIDKGRSRKRGGTGLGLAIVKNAVEIHQGTIQARSKGLGQGISFDFTIHK